MNSEFLSLETAQKLAYNEKINELYNKIDNQDKIINEQALEIAELNEGITWWQNRFNAVERDNKQLKEKIDKTIDFIDNWEKYKKDKGSLEVSMLDLLYIKEILGGKENEIN